MRGWIVPQVVHQSKRRTGRRLSRSGSRDATRSAGCIHRLAAEVRVEGDAGSGEPETGITGRVHSLPEHVARNAAGAVVAFEAEVVVATGVTGLVVDQRSLQLILWLQLVLRLLLLSIRRLVTFDGVWRPSFALRL